MAQVQVFQRNARVAAPVECEFVQTASGATARTRIVVISNQVRHAAGVAKVEKTTIRWTVWGRLAETAARVLIVGSHVNVAGSVRNNRYQDRHGHELYDFDFTAEQIDFLESRDEAQARRARTGSSTTDRGPARGGAAAAVAGVSAVAATNSSTSQPPRG